MVPCTPRPNNATLWQWHDPPSQCVAAGAGRPPATRRYMRPGLLPPLRLPTLDSCASFVYRRSRLGTILKDTWPDKDDQVGYLPLAGILATHFSWTPQLTRTMLKIIQSHPAWILPLFSPRPGSRFAPLPPEESAACITRDLCLRLFRHDPKWLAAEARKGTLVPVQGGLLQTTKWQVQYDNPVRGRIKR